MMNFSKLHDAYSKELIDYCSSLIKDKDRVIVIVSSCFVDLYGAVEDFESDENAKLFLFDSAHAKCKRFLARRDGINVNAQLN